jgi:hypothetical protein
MKENQELTKIEFLLKCNENIVVQRYFNFRNFNKNAHKSQEFYDYIRKFCYSLSYDLKMRSVIYMLENQYEISENPEVLNTSITDGEEEFNLIIKNGDTTLCHRIFDAKPYPPKVRYTVDLRPKLKTILSELTDIFSSKNFNFDYPQFIKN